jgi:hypothetical protein
MMTDFFPHIFPYVYVMPSLLTWTVASTQVLCTCRIKGIIDLQTVHEGTIPSYGRIVGGIDDQSSVGDVWCHSICSIGI